MNYQLIVVIAFLVYLAAMLGITVWVLVMEYRTNRQMFVDDRAIMLAMRKGNDLILEELRRAGSEL